MMDIQKPEVIFFDIDSTLYRKETGFIPQSALDAIAEIRRKGIKTAIATGRSQVTIPNVIRDLFHDRLMDFIVSINGQYTAQWDSAQNQFTAIGKHPIKLNDIELIVNYMKSKHWDYGFVSNTDIRVSRDSPSASTALAHIASFLIDPDFYRKNEIYQMFLFLDEADMMTFQAECKLPDNIEAIRWHPLALDVINRNGAKARGIKDACHFLGIDINRTMAFGDGLNDLDMFNTVAHAIAMGDAEPQLKKIATYVTDVVEENGIANGLRHYGLIN